MSKKFIALASALTLSFASNVVAGQAAIGEVEMSDKLINISGQGHQRTVECNGRRLEVQGTGHVVTATGQCSSVEVAGAGNTVEVTIVPKGTLLVEGSSNTVRWKATGEIKRSVSGVDNRVTRLK